MGKWKSWLTDGKLSVMLIVVLLVIDQIIKVWVKTNMYLGESIRVTDWFFIDFIENSGMAYGMTFINKFVLSLLRYQRHRILHLEAGKGTRPHLLYRLLVDDTGWSSRKHLRFDVLWADFQQFHPVFCFHGGAFRDRICRFPDGKGR